MKRCYDSLIDFQVYVSGGDCHCMTFSTDWKFAEMLDWMLNHFEFSIDHVVEIRQCFIRRYKVAKDA